jgi:diaminopimelate epimerase
MRLQFYKYHGTGNDFILIDNRQNEVRLTKEQINFLCHRRFGIGADGLMLLKSHKNYDFEMDYYNSDGARGTMCGNGGRCITAFAKHLGIIGDSTEFIASDGPHQASIDENELVKLKMIDVERIEENEGYSFLDTGSPHYVEFVDDVTKIDVYAKGKEIRYSEKYKAEGTNVNFVSAEEQGIAVRTYERGVEDETYSCGTGSVASAIAFYKRNKLSDFVIPIKTLGGNLEVTFKEKNNKFTDVFLKGPAKMVFKGEIIVE